MSRLIRLVAVIVIILAIIFSFVGCDNSKYPRPSREFYVNDFADALLPGSRNTFFYEGERLYNLTKDTDLGGAQVVVVTMLVENEGEMDEIDRTELFRKWKIGENDMGLLILLIFMDEEEYRVLIKIEIEIGYRMEQYVSASRAQYVIDYCLYNPLWEGSLDMGMGEMYYELISTIYVDAYGYDSFDYDMEDYRDYLIYAEDEIGTQFPMGLLYYFFSPYSSIWSKIIVIAVFLILGGGIFFRRRGAGGSSGGYGVRK